MSDAITIEQWIKEALEGKQSAPQTITIAENETFTLRNVLVQ